MKPLAQQNENGTAKVCQLIIAGAEITNQYAELVDPIKQEELLKLQSKAKEGGDEEAQMMDGEFVEALEYGMPPTCGFGLSERLFSFLADKPIRECQIFPFMRLKG